MSHGGHAPNRDSDDVSDPGSVPIYEPPEEKQPDGVGRLKCRYDVPVFAFAPADDFLEVRRQDAQDLAVDVVDGRGEKEEGTDRPTVISGTGFVFSLRRHLMLADSDNLRLNHPGAQFSKLLA